MVILCQQNNEFAQVNNYFVQHRQMIDKEFQKRRGHSPLRNKSLISQDRKLFMMKLDSLENAAYQYALIAVRNREDLGQIRNDNTFPAKPEIKAGSAETKADYPGGLENLRNQIANLIYLDAFSDEMPSTRADVQFTVERDGSVSSVRAEGLNASFNKQAEIAVYRLPQKFTPASINGVAVRYKYRFPVAWNVAGSPAN